jgi:hypothetical protein
MNAMAMKKRISIKVGGSVNKLWRCRLSSGRAEVEPGVIVLTKQGFGANQKRK